MSNLDFEDLDKYLIAQNGKIIHQIWFGTIPNKRSAKKAYKSLKSYRDSWLIKNPNWCHMEWNKDFCIQFVKSFYPEHQEMFKNYIYEIQRCDAVRYLLLHRYGGWYADMDYYCNRPLDEAMKDFPNNIYFVQTPNSILDDDHISNSLMYSIPNHPFWKKLMIELELKKDYRYFYGKHLSVMFTTGPGIINRVYHRNKFLFRIKSLPYKLFHPYGIGDEKLSLKNDPNVYTIHLGRGSWENSDSKFLLFLFENYRILFFIFVCVFSSLIYYSMHNNIHK
jgi:mannosyltransferase OCH1-like enzyme